MICDKCKNVDKCLRLVCFCGALHWATPLMKTEVPITCNPVRPHSEEDCVGFQPVRFGG